MSKVVAGDTLSR